MAANNSEKIDLLVYGPIRPILEKVLASKEFSSATRFWRSGSG